MPDSPGDSGLIGVCNIQLAQVFAFFEWHIVLWACGGAAARNHRRRRRVTPGPRDVLLFGYWGNAKERAWIYYKNWIADWRYCGTAGFFPSGHSRYYSIAAHAARKAIQKELPALKRFSEQIFAF